MKRFSMTVCAVAVMTLLSGCAATGSYYGGGYYASTAIYDASCDYYTPPWGYPSDYCRYQIWSDPVYSGGIWYGGPIYYRAYGGTNWFWLNNGWRRNEWRGARPRIDWSRGGNRYWSGNIVRRGGNGANSLAVPARRGGARVGGPAARNNSGGRAIRNNDGANSLAVPARRGGARLGGPPARNNGGGRARRGGARRGVLADRLRATMADRPRATTGAAAQSATMMAQTLWPYLPEEAEEAAVAKSTTIVAVVEELSEEATLSVGGALSRY